MVKGVFGQILVLFILGMTGLASIKEKNTDKPREINRACVMWNDTTIYNVFYEIHRCVNSQYGDSSLYVPDEQILFIFREKMPKR